MTDEMTDEPKRIWAYGQDGYSFDMGTWDQSETPECSSDWPHAEYHHADLSADLVRAALERAADWVSGSYVGAENIASKLRRKATDPEAVAAIITSVLGEPT